MSITNVSRPSCLEKLVTAEKPFRHKESWRANAAIVTI